jgi:hypothetical protein
METAETPCPDSAEKSAPKPPKPTRFRRQKPKLRPSRAVKLQVVTRQSLDRRTRAHKMFDAIASSIARDLGGETRLTTVQKHLVEAFAGAAITVNHLNVQLLIGKEVDICAYAQVISTLVRVASRINVGRAMRTVIDPLSYASEVEHAHDQ